VSADEAVDFFDEVGGGLEGATTDGAFGDEGEEAFDLVEPGGVGRGEVNVPTRPAGEPSSDLGMLVGGVVELSSYRGRYSVRSATCRWSVAAYEAPRTAVQKFVKIITVVDNLLQYGDRLAYHYFVDYYA
jgi:hypothetical protein